MPPASTNCANSWRGSSGSERAQRALPGQGLSIEVALNRTERVLSGTLGAASARIIVAAYGRRGRLLPRSARALIDEASEAIRYNYEILRNTLDHVGMGIAAFDRDGRLEIFNDRFTALLSLDDASVAVGVSPTEFGAAPDVVALLRRPETPQTHEITTRGGKVIELRLDPLPGGGFVATCNDVTARVRTAEALRESDRQLRQSTETLEQRVIERTAELEASRAEAEAANLGKTRFIAAASHDLLQPLHAARLFTAAMIDRDPGNDLGGKIDTSLGAVEAAARCPARHLQARCRRLQAGEAAVRPAADVRFAGHRLRAGGGPPRRRAGGGADAGLRVDRPGLPAPHPAEPAVQCAALRPAPRGGPRAFSWAAAGSATICASRSRTTDPASPPTSRPSSSTSSCACRSRTTAPREERGLGLGLAIVDRIARMLDLPVGLASAPGQGSTFSVSVPRVPAVVAAPVAAPAPQPTPSVAAESFVLCIDNEARVREAMATLLGGWGCRVAAAASQDEALALVARAGRLPDLVLADLHLDDVLKTGPTGWKSSRRCAAPGDAPCRPPWSPPTAIRRCRLRARARQVELLHKPVKPAALRALLRLSERATPAEAPARALR